MAAVSRCSEATPMFSVRHIRLNSISPGATQLLEIAGLYVVVVLAAPLAWSLYWFSFNACAAIFVQAVTVLVRRLSCGLADAAVKLAISSLAPLMAARNCSAGQCWDCQLDHSFHQQTPGCLVHEHSGCGVLIASYASIWHNGLLSLPTFNCFQETY